MNKNLRLFYNMLALVLFIASCNSMKVSKSVSANFLQTEVNPVFIEVTEKMQEQKKLTKTDYAFICDFLLNNTDEGIVEGMGGSLFKCLRGNPLSNSDFLSYLDKKRKLYKEKVLYRLVSIMFIDIKLEEYSYDAFIKDFDMFKNSASTKKAFDRCMENWVD